MIQPQPSWLATLWHSVRRQRELDGYVVGYVVFINMLSNYVRIHEDLTGFREHNGLSRHKMLRNTNSYQLHRTTSAGRASVLATTD